MKYLAWLLPLSLLIPPIALAAAPAVLSPYTAEYEVLRGGKVSGHATIELRQGDNGTWTMRTETKGTQGLAALTGIDVREVSVFRTDGPGLACIRYDYRLTGLRKRERSVECGAGAQGIVSRDHRGEYRFDARPGLLDRQLNSLALALDLAAGKTGVVEYPVVDRERLEAHRYRIGSTETLEVPAGRYAATRIERLRENSSRGTTIWLASEAGGIPLRIAHHSAERDDFEMRLVSLKR